jgi:DNA invertase Pin-like site-specific DNA recombinase
MTTKQIGYARVSTQDQDCALQIEALKKAGCDPIYTETASGAKTDRPALLEALQYAREGDVIVVWKMDRLARSLKQLIATVEDLDQRGIGLKSLTEEIDTSTAGGKLVFHIFGALAEFERSLIRERTMAGLAYARTQGRTGGRPSTITPEVLAEAEDLLRNPKRSVREVAKRLGVSRATLYRHLPGGRSNC